MEAHNPNGEIGKHQDQSIYPDYNIGYQYLDEKKHGIHQETLINGYGKSNQTTD